VELYGALKAMCEDVVRGAFGDKATIVHPASSPAERSRDRFTYWRCASRAAAALADRKARPGGSSTCATSAWLVRLPRTTGRHLQRHRPQPDHHGAVLSLPRREARVRRSSGSTTNFSGNTSQSLKEMPLWLPTTINRPPDSRDPTFAALASGITFRPLPGRRDTLAYNALPANRGARRPTERERCWSVGLDHPRAAQSR
jgi:hypothetical protein